MSNTIDLQGLCPNCKKSWEGNEIFETLRKLDIFNNRPDEVVSKLGSSYGWNIENQKKFTNVITRVIEFHPTDVVTTKNTIAASGIYYECPYCRHLWSSTGEHYNHISEVRKLIYSQNTLNHGE